MLIKKEVKKIFGVFFIFVIILFSIYKVSALGIIPAIVEEEFSPGLEKTIIYKITEKDPNKEIKIYAEGELAQYVSFDKQKLIGGGKFSATLKLPEEIKKFGRQRIFIVAEEVIEQDEEVVSTVGTSVTIKGIIDINVPYSGKYLEIFLKSNDVNVGEPVNFELEIVSWGKEDVIAAPKIEIFSLPEQKLIETLQFKEREIKSRETIQLEKTLDTADYNAGNYRAIAILDYGEDEPAKAESDFRIGELVIDIIDYTKQIIIKDFQSFNIEIESKWNDKIDGVYAEVFIFDESKILADFKTSSAELIPWERKNITGFFDTNNFEEGFYNANMTLIYYGKDVGKSASKIVEVEFIKEKPKILLIIVVILAGFVILLLLLIITWILIKKYLKKDGKPKKSKK